MNTEAIRKKFELEIRQHLTGIEAVIALQKDSTGYVYAGTANQFEQYLKGYQQAVKDMESGLDSEDLDEQLKAAGLLTVSECMAGQPIDGFIVNAQVKDLETFKQWLDMRTREIKTMKAKRSVEKKSDDDLFEWVCAHDAAFNEIRLNFNAAMSKDHDQ